MPSSGEASWQVIGMQGFRMAFGVAALVTIVDTGVMVLRLVRARLRKDGVALTIPLK
jgi:hypothetical protein